MAKLARVAWNGERISCGTFTESARVLPESRRVEGRPSVNFYIPDDEYLRIGALPRVSHESLKGKLDDGDTYERYQYGSDKYGRLMYCVKTKTVRSQTMAEFYGSSEVD